MAHPCRSPDPLRSADRSKQLAAHCRCVLGPTERSADAKPSQDEGEQREGNDDGPDGDVTTILAAPFELVKVLGQVCWTITQLAFRAVVSRLAVAISLSTRISTSTAATRLAVVQRRDRGVQWAADPLKSTARRAIGRRKMHVWPIVALGAQRTSRRSV
eukprot:5313272-Prymnesium_polylepis.1